MGCTWCRQNAKNTGWQKCLHCSDSENVSEGPLDGQRIMPKIFQIYFVGFLIFYKV